MAWNTLTNGTNADATEVMANFNRLMLMSPMGSNIQVFEASGTWTVPTDVENVWVICVGGGGAGAGQNSWNDDARFALAGGGAGGTAMGNVDVSGETDVTITVGSGATGGTGIGPSGGDSTFGAFMTGNGGSGGDSTTGGSGGTASNGDINIPGGRGADGIYSDIYDADASHMTSGYGGNSLFGFGGPPREISGNGHGHNGVGYGAGGGGTAGSGSDAFGSNSSGGDGADGAVIIFWKQKT